MTLLTVPSESGCHPCRFDSENLKACIIVLMTACCATILIQTCSLACRPHFRSMSHSLSPYTVTTCELRRRAAADR